MEEKRCLLCNNHKYFLTKKKKYDLTQKYIAFNYLEKMNNEMFKDKVH